MDRYADTTCRSHACALSGARIVSEGNARRQKLAHVLVACSRGDHGDGSHTHTATPVANHGTWRHSTASDELGPLFLSGRQRSVNRKVRSSNLRPGANFVC